MIEEMRELSAAELDIVGGGKCGFIPGGPGYYYMECTGAGGGATKIYVNPPDNPYGP
jgi:hypothetical protein